ncbi:HAD-superfamily subfamily IIA hydrolase, TIGR01457 [Saccharopolyspora antimicrobica]|uniref:HAD superfamily hydrolase (TIGR01457 family) n=1 Tax=Saccharopolyspora antimicrobica TaxID=455193 RepID=A0A1I5H5E3_9PSEU|nr:HAD-IIA family hydrolase [Saccharopolyspora antimicrobica]RKT90152.1 HAD superfamily hydrolase (TIGR01457 family) [Saccharopolyspora antimicrobica]SFO43494.1 HAD-superfamily subfamily IIA hydrolase, TIGR01457 [Saccharopolyspora antimicrobica]
MSGTLLDGHDVVLFDLDGTVFRGGELVPGAFEAVREVHRRGVQVRYVTNNASKPDQAVVDHLAALGLTAERSEVSTSAQAGAAVLAEKLPAGSRVLVVGSAALASEVDRAGLVPVSDFADEPVAVVQGLSTEIAYRDLAEACLAIRAGALWVACNGDRTLPTERGLMPGNGSLVELLRAATDQEPLVAGKPERPLLDRAVDSAGGRAPLMVGDRLDTDIAGAVNAGMPSLMVLTGVSTAGDLLAASAQMRPDHVAADLRGLLQAPAEIAIGAQDGWQVRVEDSGLELSRADGEADALAALRALCAAWWAVSSGAVEVRAADEHAKAALRELGLA